MDKTDRNTIEELLPRYCEGWQRKKNVCKLRCGWANRTKIDGWQNRYMLFILPRIQLMLWRKSIRRKLCWRWKVECRVTDARERCGGNGHNVRQQFVHSTSRYIDAPVLGRKRTGIGTNHGSENKSWDDDLIDPADGTLVYLNSESTLSYPSRFDNDTRNVTLQGEAYFEVAKNPEKEIYSLHFPSITNRSTGNSF